MVERREAPGDIVGLVVGGGGRADQPDPFRAGRNNRKHDRRFQRSQWAEVDAVRYGRLVGQEDGIEGASFRDASDLDVVVDVEGGARVAAFHAPGCRGETRVQDIDVEMKLPSAHWNIPGSG